MYYYFYNKIVYMDELFDPDLCPEKYLKFLAGMIGWKLIGADVDSWREQIKAAPLLYKVRGTKRGLLLAEKLVGYSIFMSELYRDHVGDAVPKERIFNNTPEEIKQKPWFRKVLTSVEGELLGGYAESDQFDSFNMTDIVKLDAFGQVIRPRILSSTRKLIFKNVSTTEFYNNITGKNSIARYAKLPRLNVVLKYEHDLDEELADGSIKQNNFKGALDLLLQFKPFHVYIENLEVRYSLAEYVFDQASMTSETLNIHESVLSAARVEMARAENTITFSGNQVVEFSTASAEIPLPAAYNRGVISSIYKLVDLSIAESSTDSSLYSVFKKAFPIKSFDSTETVDAVNFLNSHILGWNDPAFVKPSTIALKAEGDTIINQAQYVLELPPTPFDPIAVVSPTPIPQFLSNPINTNYYLGSENLGLRLKCAANSSDNTEPIIMSWYKDGILYHTDDYSRYWTGVLDVYDTIYVESTLSIVESDLTGTHTYTCRATNSNGYVTSSGAIVTGIQAPVHAVLGYNLKPYITAPVLDFKAMLSTQNDTYIVTDTFINSKLAVPRYAVGIPSTAITSIVIDTIPYRSSITVNLDTQSIISNPSRPWDLNDVQTFSTATSITTLDAIKTVYDNFLSVVLEYSSYKITLQPGIDYYFDNLNSNIFLNSAAIAVKVGGPTNFTFLTSSKLHILYLTRTTYEDETSEGFQKRGFRYKIRQNAKFSRQYAINTLPQESIARLMPTEIVSVDTKTKKKTVLGTKQFKVRTEIPNRSTLKNEVIDGYNVVNKDPLNRMDQSKWTVYSPEFTAYYLGDQKVTNNWWGNYYQAKFPDINIGEPAFVSYSEIDRSESAQKKNVYSNQWISALRLLNLSDPKHFLVTRKTDSARTGFWKRNSCRFVSIPFIRSRRDTLQVFRRDNPTFTRSEESTDYPVDSSVPYRLDNYKYILPDGTDVSYSYFTPGFSEIDKVSVTMDRGIGEKATISLNPVDTTHPAGLQGIKGYNLSFPESDTYYNNYSSDVTAETYFIKNTSNEYVAKSSLYAGNIPVSRDPSQFTGITEGLDKFDLLVTGLEIVNDTFVAVANKSSFVLSKYNLFVTWTEPNTGASISFGYYPPYNVLVIPNIVVTLNGLVISYGTDWTITFDKLKTLNILCPIEATDVVTIEYQVFPGEVNLATIPSPQIPRLIDITLSTNDIAQIQQGNRYLIGLLLETGAPCVSWYSSITADFISYGLTPIEYQPFALYEEAEPNITVNVNGIILKYKKDWSFLLKKNTLGVVTAAIALSPLLSLSLSVNDEIKVQYFSTT
jgi:hypothetical protein